ncbi:hypothetical protein EJ05DRAFT_481426 [Pseudovirgaria hyperparasitica]|uniref:ferric-chelate reductase (NADPH) n=1 Tax=Pseudovirgaria hyperparasitica TaxID=470096 RepID=A0A6A6WI56_9PEZI|nr:uncharacterized protein EJ05DRAFT_481426 [Pseudovirgaria hyperparasitica]KAF2762493.1 hypothetical protein EJ05DRAFT_481426 [Pseudovirgaria hyperparasitica]
MPVLPEVLSAPESRFHDHAESAAVVVRDGLAEAVQGLSKRLNIPSSSTSPAGLVEANTRDPWSKSGKYALGWVYFCLILLVSSALVRFYNLFTDRIRAVLYEAEVIHSAKTMSPDTDYEMSALDTDRSTRKFFPREGPLPSGPKTQSSISSVRPILLIIALFRWVFYRPTPVLTIKKGWRPFVLPSMATVAIVGAAFAFTICYIFVPQPLYWQSLEFGAPPVTVRSGMLAVALMPWIVGLSMKANIISVLTGIGHERLNVYHRWGGILCLFLSLVHTVPFYLAGMQDRQSEATYKAMLNPRADFYIYGSGIAALVPLGILCIHSLPHIRARMYEVFVITHVPISMVFLGMLFWHCNNYLTSWNYLFATLGIWLFSYMTRLLYLNWTNPFHMAWLIGDEAAVTILPENAIKVTIPTRMRWRPGQYVYLRMPGVSVFENHPFTVASLCSDDFPSDYGEDYRDMVLVFRPFKGFTQRVLISAQKHGPWHTYRAFLDGPYGGMNRRMESFDHVVLIAGGSGITAVASQLLNLIKRMRDGKAVTKSIQVIWALKRPETMEWFKEELHICREFAPPGSVQCQFFITTAKRQPKTGMLVSAQTPNRPVSMHFHDKVNHAFTSIADKRASVISSKRVSMHSALIADEAGSDAEREQELRREREDTITALPQAHLLHVNRSNSGTHLQAPIAVRSIAEKRRSRNLSLDIAQAVSAGSEVLDPAASQSPHHFDFGFPNTPTEFQKNLMRFAFLPAAVKKKDGWSKEYGRPDIPFMLRGFSKSFGRRTCVFVCGPPGMRTDVQRTVADLQRDVLGDADKDEIFLHAENYAI